MSKSVKLGIVGAGAIAHAYATAIGNTEGVDLVAVVDPEPGVAAALADKYTALPLASHRELLNGGACDAVIVSAPPSTHEDLVLDSIAAGMPVLCEKPFTTDGASARRMANAAREAGVLVAMASKFRYVDDLHVARDMIVAGEIGSVKLIENVFTGVVDMTNRWNANKAVSGGGVLIDNGTHSADVIRYLAGPIRSVSAAAGPRFQPVGVEDHVFAYMQTTRGVRATVETSWSVHKDRFAYIGIYGTKGSIELGWKNSRIRRDKTGPWESFGTGYDKFAAFAGQVADFANGVAGKPTRCLGDLEDAIASVDVVSAGYASIADGGRWVAVEEASSRPRLEVLEAVS